MTRTETVSGDTALLNLYHQRVTRHYGEAAGQMLLELAQHDLAQLPRPARQEDTDERA